jgi:hypothetical protein
MLHSTDVLVTDLGLTAWQAVFPRGNEEWLVEEQDILKAAWKLCLELASARPVGIQNITMYS